MNLKIITQNPIYLSFTGLIIVTLVCILTLYIWKPNFVTIVSKNKIHILWGKLVSLSLTVGTLFAIVLYFSNTTPPVIEPVKMGFNKVCNSY